ncbi:MAG: hypothetical protein ACI9IP_000916 [Arcticibacterium sp.]|jgi:hypothetical protein
MIILENIIIIALLGLALGYLIKMVYNQFTKEDAGCASCSGCSVDETLSKMPKIVNQQN